MAYRVFISYKHTTMDGTGVTRDYTIASELHSALTRAGVPTFFSEKDLSTGDYINEIYEALEEADIMIVVGTRPDHIRSQWVKEEWSTFIAEINGKRKPNGDVYTYLEGMMVNELPSMLYKRQSYTTKEKEHLVNRISFQLGMKGTNTSDTRLESVNPSVPKAAQKPIPVTQPVNQSNPAIYTVPNSQQSATAPIFKDSTAKQQLIHFTEKTVNYTPLIVTVAVVLVVAIVSGIWAISNATGNSRSTLSDGLSSNSTDDSRSTSSDDLTSSSISDSADDSTQNVKSLSELGSVSVGDHFTFGNYPQGADGEVQPIEWRVLAVKSGKALVISEGLLDCVQYNKEYTSVTWETCTLRKWMNNNFLSKAFSSSQQAKIAAVTNDNPDNPNYDTNGGNATRDKIFALSMEEAEKYFWNDNDRMAAPTEYAKKQGSYVSDNYLFTTGEKTSWWWLRSPGAGSYFAAFVSSDGLIYRNGFRVYNSNGSVRPAFWLNL